MKKTALGGFCETTGHIHCFLAAASFMRCITSSLLMGCRVAMSWSQASFRVRPGITGDSACGPAAVKFLDLGFIGNSNVVDGERFVVTIRQSYQQEPKFIGVADKKVMVRAEWKSGAVVPLMTVANGGLNFSIADKRDTGVGLALAQREQAEVEAPAGEVIHEYKKYASQQASGLRCLPVPSSPIK